MNQRFDLLPTPTPRSRACEAFPRRGEGRGGRGDYDRGAIMTPAPGLSDVDALFESHGLRRVAPALRASLAPAIALVLSDSPNDMPITASRFGGDASVPHGFAWPERRGRRLDFLLQVDLRDVARVMPGVAMPRDGLLAFFYDIANQPWGFDPSDLDGFRVMLFDARTALESVRAPDPACRANPRAMALEPRLTIPQSGSRDYERAIEPLELTDDEFDRYVELDERLSAGKAAQGPPGRHQMFGHPYVIQNDMQLEAQLVSSGLFCGDSSGYDDPRRAELEAKADEWVLLLQVDSGEAAGAHTLDWGDVGMLYFWIRRDDLRDARFDRVWMTLQCC
jgi:uncharacterized protein YwqG